LALSGWRSLTGRATWRCQLAERLGGPVWRTSLAVSPVVRRVEPKLISTLRSENRQVSDGARWFPTVGALWLALFDWRRTLAVSVGGAGWRCCLWRCGFEPRLISEIRCEDRKVPGGESWSPAVGALWLALSGWRSLTGGATWRCLLAEPLGGPGWRTSLAVSPVAVRFEPRLMSVLRCDDRQVPGGESWSPAVGALWLALSDWRSNLAVSVGGATRRTCLAEPLGGVSWRTTLADQLGGVTRGGVGVEPKPISTLRCEDRKVPGGARWSPAAGAL
jgi:hypothetical protein